MAFKRFVSFVIYSPEYVKLRHGCAGKMSTANQHNCTKGVEEDADDINRALALSGLRSSSPSRPPNDGFAETNKEGIITRSASKRKGVYEQLSAFKGTSHFKQG